MSMPRDFGFGDEALMLRDAARRFFQTNMPADRLHRLVAANPDPAREPECAWDRGLWQQMAELGWTGLAWVAAGGVIYTAGIVFYVFDEKVRHFHGIWHLFVMGGSAIHYAAVLRFVA